MPSGFFILFTPLTLSVAVTVIVTLPLVQSLGFVEWLPVGAVSSLFTVKYTVTGTDILPQSSAAHIWKKCWPFVMLFGIVNVAWKYFSVPFGVKLLAIVISLPLSIAYFTVTMSPLSTSFTYPSTSTFSPWI